VTLRRRLTLLVALAVVVPITAVGVSVVNLVSEEVEARSYDRLRQAAVFARSSMVSEAEDVNRAVQAAAGNEQLASLAARGGAPLEDALRRWLVEVDLDVAVIVDESGGVAASARREPAFSPGIEAPTDEEIGAGGGEGRVVTVGSPLVGTTDRLVAGQWLDATRLSRLPRAEDAELSLAFGNRVVASTSGLLTLPDRPLEGEFKDRFGGRSSLVVAAEVPGTGATIVATSRPPLEARRTNLIVILAALLVVVVVLIVLVANTVSGFVTRPVQDLVDAAESVSRGDLEKQVEVQGDLEVATLGHAFNQMTANLREYVSQLEQSRTEFRQAVARLGDVLTATHDLSGIVDVVLEACTLTVRAETAVFYERVAMPARIRATALHGTLVDLPELNGTGVAGSAARLLAPVNLADSDVLDPSEPQVAAAAAVPVTHDGRLFGVVAVYGRSGDGPFKTEDLDTLVTLARQAEVAIGNVMLHDEARRQARTDGMTGLWNRREFELRCQEAMREAARFKDPFGVMVLDIDDFKRVNDTWDHSMGDAAIIWVASRLSEAVREIDLVARWGGEEFIVMLPRAGLEETGIVAERVRKAVAREPLREDGVVIPLTVSIGYAVYADDGETMDQLFRAADGALLRAKRSGKNRVERATVTEGVA
jgi:two-component system, cell cycle response regulator